MSENPGLLLSVRSDIFTLKEKERKSDGSRFNFFLLLVLFVSDILLLFYFLIETRSQLPIGGQSLPDIHFCQLNISQCDASESSNRFVVNVYNPLARHVDKYIRVPVATGVFYQVLDPDGRNPLE